MVHHSELRRRRQHMEHKVGEFFDFKGVRLQVKIAVNGSCSGCFFDNKQPLCAHDGAYQIAGSCADDGRTDGNDVIFIQV